jgi:hypothetical protein
MYVRRAVALSLPFLAFYLVADTTPMRWALPLALSIDAPDPRAGHSMVVGAWCSGL